MQWESGMPAAVLVHCENFEVPLQAGPDLADVTPLLARIIAASGVRRGERAAFDGVADHHRI